MISLELVIDELRILLAKYQKAGSLDKQTPRLIREQLAASLNETIQVLDAFKADIKMEINAFVNSGVKTSPSTPTRVVDKSSSSSSSDESDSASALRSIAKMLGVAPGFWSGLDREDVVCIKSKLRTFCESKDIQLKGEIPTMKEAKEYKAKREAAAELEGINSSNIVSGKRRRFQDLLF